LASRTYCLASFMLRLPVTKTSYYPVESVKMGSRQDAIKRRLRRIPLHQPVFDLLVIMIGNGGGNKNRAEQPRKDSSVIPDHQSSPRKIGLTMAQDAPPDGLGLPARDSLAQRVPTHLDLLFDKVLADGQSDLLYARKERMPQSQPQRHEEEVNCARG